MRQAEILEAIRSYGRPVTVSEIIADHSDWDRNTILNRIYKMLPYGLVFRAGMVGSYYEMLWTTNPEENWEKDGNRLTRKAVMVME